jgi:hypothetical protein
VSKLASYVVMMCVGGYSIPKSLEYSRYAAIVPEIFYHFALGIASRKTDERNMVQG